MTDNNTNKPINATTVDETVHNAPASKQSSTQEDKMRADIAEILEEVKLPERHEFKASADIPQDPKTDQLKTPLQVTATQPKIQTSIDEKMSSDTNVSKDIIRPLHTFKEDVDEVVRVKKISLVQAAALESDKIRSQKVTTPVDEPVKQKQIRRRVGVIAALVTFIVIGTLALGAVLLVESQRSGDIPTPQEDSLMFAEQTMTISIDDLTPRELKTLLVQARDQSNVTLGAITRIAPTLTVPATEENPATLRLATAPEFLAAIGSNAPAELSRALGDELFLGIHAVDRTVPVLVLSVTSYERAFASMLSWEGGLSDGLAPLFPAVLQQSREENGAVVTNRFEDAVVRNFDARVLKDASGNVRILYAFPTRNILIIAESPYSFVEALSRLQAERRLQ